MKDNVIYLNGNRRYFTARELSDVLQRGWTPDDQLSLGDLCHAAETWAESVSLDDTCHECDTCGETYDDTDYVDVFVTPDNQLMCERCARRMSDA